jgi:hypothetical protein
MEKYAARRVKQEIDRVLWEVWDPIGVNKFPDARGEYSGYVNGVFELLTPGASDEVITQHLIWITTDRMGLDSPGFSVGQTVSALRAIPLPSALC